MNPPAPKPLAVLIIRGETFQRSPRPPEPLLRGRRWRLVHPDAPLLVPQTLLRTRRRPLQLVHQQAGVRQVFLIVAPVRRRRARGVPPRTASPPPPASLSRPPLRPRCPATPRTFPSTRVSPRRRARWRVEGWDAPQPSRRCATVAHASAHLHPRAFVEARLACSTSRGVRTRPPERLQRPQIDASVHAGDHQQTTRGEVFDGRDGASMRSPRAELDDSGRRIRRRTRRVDAGEVQPGHVEHANVPSAVAREHVVVSGRWRWW